MKKTIIAVLLTVCVMTALGIGVIDNINQTHENELKELNAKFETEMEQANSEHAKLMNEHWNLERNVYKMMNDEDYDITVDHNGETHVWTSDDNDGFVKSKLQNTVEAVKVKFE